MRRRNARIQTANRPRRFPQTNDQEHGYSGVSNPCMSLACNNVHDIRETEDRSKGSSASHFGEWTWLNLER